MAGYIGTQAVSVNTTSATISDDLSVGDDLTVTDDATIGGNLDVDGVTNLDVVDIDGQLTQQYAGGGDFIAVFQNTTAASPYGVMIKDAASGANGYPLFQVVDDDGSETHFKVQTGTGNVEIGAGSDFITKTLGTSNFVAGVNAGNSIASGGNYNVCVGDEAGTGLTTADYNTIVGYQAGTGVMVAGANTFVGSQAGKASTDGYDNTAIGYGALTANTKGGRCTAVGRNALITQNVTSAGNTNNTAVGYNAGQAVSTGTNNVMVGAAAGVAVNTGNNNVLIGFEAGDAMTTGHENICIGFGPRISAVGGNNQIVMGEAVVGNANSSFVFGTGASDSAIGNGSTTITAPSDQRYKEEIADATAGLSFIKDLRPVTFKWKKEKDLPTSHRAYVEGSEKRTMNDYTNHGFIAQEVKTAIDAHSEIKDGFDMWCTDDQADGGRQRLGDASLMPLMVKAVQEQNALIVALTARVATLEG